MNHSLAIGPLAAALFLAATGLAAAHASLTPASAANGSSVRIAITIPHGCDGAPTDTVRIALPEGLVDARPQEKPGWALAITKGDYQKTYNVHGSPVTAGAVAIEWSGGAVPDDAFDEFVIQGTLQGFDAETDLPFIVTVGAALSMIPGGVAAEAVRAGRPTDTIEENWAEVMNICSSLWNALHAAHVTLGEHYIPPRKPPPDFALAVRQSKTRIDMELTVPGYPTGRLSLLTFNLY